MRVESANELKEMHETITKLKEKQTEVREIIVL